MIIRNRTTKIFRAFSQGSPIFLYLILKYLEKYLVVAIKMITFVVHL